MKKAFTNHNMYGDVAKKSSRIPGRGWWRFCMKILLVPLKVSGIWLRWLCGAQSASAFFRKIFISLVAFVCACFLWGLLWMGYLFLTLPDIDDIGALFAAQSTIITDRNGIELYRIHADEDRTLVPLSEIQDSVKLATIAIEDERFYERGCLDVRALIRVVTHMGKAGGGSTITRQLARNALGLKKEGVLNRKLKELFLGCQLESRFTKDQILELYLNRIPYGHNAHGVEQAAHIYFAKSASGLTLAEASILAALPKMPTYLSPYGDHIYTILSEGGKRRFERGDILTSSDVQDPDFWLGLIGQEYVLTSSGIILGLQGAGSGALMGAEPKSSVFIGGRTDQVLKNMESLGYIVEQERKDALAELPRITFKRARENIRAPHFVLWVRELVMEQFVDQFDDGFLEKGGLTITTTLDWGLQQRAETIVREIGEHNINLYDAHNAALLSLDPKTGQILAYVGNRDYWDEATDGNVDIVRSPRQPGSSFKPFVYAAAFLNGYGPETVLYDVPTKIGDDEPENYDGAFLGPLTARRALGGSRNIPAAKAFFLAGGEERILELVEQMGVVSPAQRRRDLSEQIGEPYRYGWPLALGAAETPLMEMVQGYATFARYGVYKPIVSILRVEDSRGNILYQTPEKPEEREVLDPRVAYMITSILSDASVRPTQYWRDQLTIPGISNVAKTGTSNKCLRRNGLGKCVDRKPDNTWTIGYTPKLVTGVWAGNSSGGALYPKASGLDTASHMWKQFMTSAHRVLSGGETTFPPPEGLESAQISELSGELASTCTPPKFRRAEIFREGETPKVFDSACVVTEVDKLTGLLASQECPVEAREERSFFRAQSVLPDRWPLWEKGVQEWVHAAEAGTGTLTIGPDGFVTGSGLIAMLPLPVLPTEECRLSLTPGRLVKPTLSILSPSPGGSASAPAFRPRLEYSVGNSVLEIRFEVDGLVMARGIPGTELIPKVRLPRRFKTAGKHTLKVTLVDSYFNEVSDTVQFTFRTDTKDPTISIISPADGVILLRGSRIKVVASANDKESGMDRVQFFIGKQLITSARSNPYTAILPVDVPPGVTKIRVKAIDMARNEAEAEIVVQVVE